MENERKRRFRNAADEKVANVHIKQEVEWMTEDLQAPALAKQVLELDMASLRAIKTEEVDDGPHAVPEFTPDSQTPAVGYEGTKTQLTSDEEFMDEKNDCNSSCSSQKNDRRFLEVAHEQKTRVSTANNESRTYLRSAEHCERPYKCELCPRSFKLKCTLRKHLNTHAKDRERKFPCQSCKSAFYTQHHLTKHMWTHSGETFNCEVCGASYKQKVNLEIHTLRHHKDVFLGTKVKLNGEEKSAKNAQQSQQRPLEFVEEPQARMRISVRQSKASQLPTQSWAYKCELCSRSFKTKYTLKDHLNTHAEDRERKFPCQSCEKAFYTKSYLTRHMRTHSRENFNCSLCGVSCKQKASLFIHQLRFHRHVFTRTELLLDAEEQSANYSRERQQSTLELVDEQRAPVSPTVSQIRAYELISDSHLKNLEGDFSEINPITEDSRVADESTNPKEEFISDEEFIDEQNSSDFRKH